MMLLGKPVSLLIAKSLKDVFRVLVWAYNTFMVEFLWLLLKYFFSECLYNPYIESLLTL